MTHLHDIHEIESFRRQEVGEKVWGELRDAILRIPKDFNDSTCLLIPNYINQLYHFLLSSPEHSAIEVFWTLIKSLLEELAISKKRELDFLNSRQPSYLIPSWPKEGENP